MDVRSQYGYLRKRASNGGSSIFNLALEAQPCPGVRGYLPFGPPEAELVLAVK
jgi:hypothetical protein